MLETKSLTSCVWHKAATQWMGANLYKYEEGWHYISNTKISRGSPPPLFGALIFRQLEDGSCKHLNTLSKAVCYYQSKEHVSTVLPTVGMTTAKWMQITQTCNTFTFGKQRQKCMIYTHLHDCRSRPGLAHWADLVCDLYVHFWQLLGLFIVIWQILTLPHFLEFVIKNI